jgi:hypothetical protein
MVKHAVHLVGLSINLADSLAEARGQVAKGFEQNTSQDGFN